MLRVSSTATITTIITDRVIATATTTAIFTTATTFLSLDKNGVSVVYG